MEKTKESYEEKGKRALERAMAPGVREFALERSMGEFDYLGRREILPYNSAEVLRQIIKLKIN